MTSERPIEPEILISHSGAIRALALELLGDSHAADDVLQDTFVRAIVAPPPKRESLGGWLRTVAEGLARNQRRSEARRADREARYAEDRGATRYDSEKRSATLRAVMEAVLALDEPYRATILQRYFEGASPTAIAERERVPLATVASRLQRAHKLLRERIERRLGSKNGGASSALALLVGKSPSLSLAHAPQLALSAGAIAMGTKVTLSAGAAVIAVVIAWALWRGDSPSSPIVDAKPTVESASPAKPATAALDSVASSAPKIESERKSASVESANAAAAAPAPLATGPFAFDLDVVPLDEFERPLSAAEVFAAPPGQPLDRFGNTDWDGVLRRKWHGSEPAIDLVLQARRDGFGESAMQLVHVFAGAKQRVILPLVKFANSESRGTTLSFVMTLSGSGGQKLTFVNADDRPSFEVDAKDNGFFTDPYMRFGDDAKRSRESAVATVVGERLARELTFDLGGNAEISLDSLIAVDAEAKPDTDAPPPTAMLSGTALLPDGTPAAKVHVSLSAATGAFREDQDTDSAGNFTFGSAPIGDALLSVGGHAAGRIDERLNLIAGEQHWKGTLQSHSSLRVKLVGVHGEPLEGWRVEAWTVARTSEFTTAELTDKSGVVALHLPNAAGFRLIARPNSGSPLGMPIAESVWPNGDQVSVPLREDPTVGGLKLELARSNGDELETAEVRAWRVDTGLGAMFAKRSLEDGDKSHTLFESLELMPGDYDLEAGAPGCPWTALGRIHVSAGVQTDLGVERLEASRDFELRLSEPNVVERATGVLSATRNGAIVRSQNFELELPAHLAMPRGANAIDWTRFAMQIDGANDDGTTRYKVDEKGTLERIELDAKDVLELAPVEHR